MPHNFLRLATALAWRIICEANGPKIFLRDTVPGATQGWLSARETAGGGGGREGGETIDHRFYCSFQYFFGKLKVPMHRNF